MNYLGIDPGQNGGIAVIGPDTAEAWRYPGDIPTAATLARDIAERTSPVLACIERVSAMPKQGVTSTFKFGANYGGWQGILSALGVPYITVMPRKWQSVLLDSGTGETKERSLSMARRLYPGVDLRYRADDGKADALHLARWAQRSNNMTTEGD